MRIPTLLAVCSALAFASGIHAEPTIALSIPASITDRSTGYAFDVNSDGTPDLHFAFRGESVNNVFGWDAFVGPAPGPGATFVRFGGELDEFGTPVLARFVPGEPVGPAIDDGLNAGVIAYEEYFTGASGGAWLDGEPGFIGFSFFSVDAQRHYGWAELEVYNVGDPRWGYLRITLIAYESEPGVPIAAGNAGSTDCTPIDFAEPFGTIDLADIAVFVTAFVAADLSADINADGLLDLSDLTDFVTYFLLDCR